MVRTLQASDQFEVTWDEPDAAEARWQYDREHCHGTLTRFELEAQSVGVGIAHDQTVIAINGRPFAGPPTMPAPPREIRHKHYAELWDHYRDQAIAPAREVIERDLHALSDADIAGGLADDLRGTAAGFRATQSPVFKMFTQLHPFAEFCRTHFGDPEGLLIQYRLLQGGETETTRAALELERLAISIEDDEALLAALEAGQAEHARAEGAHDSFFAALDDYLDRYGWRASIWTDKSTPTWAEDPGVPLAMIVRYARDPGARPSAATAASRDDQETALAEVLARLPDDDARAQLRAFVVEHQRYAEVREERAHWQLVLSGSLRRPLLELGRRLAARGLLDDPSDVLHLEVAELVAVEAGQVDGRALVAEHRRQFEHWKTLSPPDFVGSGAAAPGPLDRLNQPPLDEHLSADGRRVSGAAASMGVAHGRARVIVDLADAGRLNPGEVLVCRTTAPPWTPLFAIASAVVTDGGGILSHSAIVAREYKIPAVVGTSVATTAIPDGAMITVDGNRGVVQIDERGS